VNLPTPYFEDREHGITLYCGDCREILPLLPDGECDACVTDPPYGVKIACWDNEMPPQSILDECLSVATGTVIWFGAASMVLEFAKYEPRPDRLIIWSPRFTLLKIAKNGLAYRWHPIALWRDYKQSVISWDILDDPTECGNGWEHPATKPIALMSKLVSAWSVKSVLDPFCGSGTTLVAAKQLGRKAIGIEISEKYCKIAVDRLRQMELFTNQDKS
jgi:site-specific DNA-methyltransferase (adenine-specific)